MLRFIVVASLLLWLPGCKQEVNSGSSVPVPPAASPPQPPLDFAPKPFDPNLEALPSLYGGVTGTNFFDLLLEKVDAARKDQFETTAQYQARIADADTIIAPLSTRSEYLFLLKNAYTTYDADRGSYGTDRSCDAMYGDEGGNRGLACSVDQTLRSGGLYGYQLRDISVLMDRAHARAAGLKKGPYSSYHQTYRCPASPEKARSLKDADVVIALVGRIKSIDLYRETTSFENWDTPAGRQDVGVEFIGIPFLPTRWVCYARKTGEILHTQAIQP